MNDKKIQEALAILQVTSALVSQLAWRDDPLGAQTSNGVIEKIQKATSTTKGNLMYLLSDRSHLIDLVQILHEASIRDNEEICKLKHELNSTQDCLKDAQEVLQEYKVQNEKLLEDLQSSWSPTYVFDFCMDDSMKIPHGMVDHEIQTDL